MPTISVVAFVLMVVLIVFYVRRRNARLDREHRIRG